MGRTGPPLEPRHRLQAGKSGDPRSQNTDRGITVVPNDKDELIPQRIITGYRIVNDFRKLNRATKKIITPYLLLIEC